MNHFRAKFLENLALALAVYPDARVEADGVNPLILHPSRAPVDKRYISR
jgi:hypothetical protein